MLSITRDPGSDEVMKNTSTSTIPTKDLTVVSGSFLF
jgi:hypothetical protein